MGYRIAPRSSNGAGAARKVRADQPLLPRPVRQRLDHAPRGERLLHRLEAREHTAQVDGGHARTAGGAVSSREPAGAVLLADDGTRRRYRPAQHGLYAERAADPRELCPAERSGRTQWSTRPGRDLLCGQVAARPVFFPRPGPYGRWRGQRAALDLANEDLMSSHLHAVWLAETGQRLGLHQGGSRPRARGRAARQSRAGGRAGQQAPRDRAARRAYHPRHAGRRIAAGAGPVVQRDWLDSVISGAFLQFGQALSAGARCSGRPRAR